METVAWKDSLSPYREQAIQSSLLEEVSSFKGLSQGAHRRKEAPSVLDDKLFNQFNHLRLVLFPTPKVWLLIQLVTFMAYTDV